MKVFYGRVSTQEQNEARQTEAAKQNECEKVLLDRASCKNGQREELEAMLSFVRQGDIVYVSEIARLARNTADLLSIVNELNEKGVDFISLKEAIDTRTPQGKFMLTVFGAMAELERAYILQRQAEGIAEAKKIPGKYQGRKPMDIDRKKFNEMCRRWRAGEITAVSIQKEFGMTATTFYKKVKAWEL